MWGVEEEIHWWNLRDIPYALWAKREVPCDQSPCPKDSHVKITFGWWLQLLLTELGKTLPCGLLSTIRGHSVPSHQVLGQAVHLLPLLLPLLLLFLSCPQQGHVFEVGHRVVVLWGGSLVHSLQLSHLCWHGTAARALDTSCPWDLPGPSVLWF